MKKKLKQIPELLYFGRGSTPSVTMHKHPFYQMELCLSGNLICLTEERKFALFPGELWLIPPGLPHKFIDDGKPYEYLTLKFKFGVMFSQIIYKDDITEYYLAAMLDVISRRNALSPFVPGGKSVLENHLYGILRHLRPKTASEQANSRFIMRIREEICRQGYKVNVDQLAQFCRCTRSQFKYKFSKETDGNTNIKGFIDDIIIEMIDKHLKYSSLSLNQIAAEMQFPSIFVLSRFFKRKTGITLSEYRVKNR